ncbi:MAG: nodulation protein NfeD [Spirochaetes bacterium]|nr:MAG: nodulation protein NfeD [Spirochaetota bacterium]
MKGIILPLLFIFLLPIDISARDREAVQAFVIPIHGDIDPSLTVFIRRGIEKARSEKAKYVIFDIDTFGGRVDSALQITTLIGSLDSTETVAYVTVRPEGTGVSWSAGALISFSCNRIYMAPGTSMGAAAPVYQTVEGTTETAPEKVVSAVRTQMAALAEKNGYPKAIALAMVDEEIELVEAHVDGQVKAVTREEYQELKREEETKGKTVEMGKVISPQGKLLSLTAGEALKYGVSSGSPETTEELFEALGIPSNEATMLEESPADRLVAFITGSGFTGLLIMIGLLAFLLEISSPGFGIPGTVGIICFAVLFASNFLLGTVGSLELLLFLLGIVLLIVEIFVIPGFGITGITGLLLMAVSLILSMQHFLIPSFQWEWTIFHRNILTVLSGLVGAFIFFSILAYFLPKVSFFERLTLKTSQETVGGYTVQAQEESERYIGKRGVTVTTLRPSGKAEIEGEVVPVESEGDFIAPGKGVRVIRVDGNRIIVREC